MFLEDYFWCPKKNLRKHVAIQPLPCHKWSNYTSVSTLAYYFRNNLQTHSCLSASYCVMWPLFNKDFILVPVDMAEWLFYLVVHKHGLEIVMVVCDMERFKLTSVEVSFLLMHLSFFFKLIIKKNTIKKFQS